MPLHPSPIIPLVSRDVTFFPDIFPPTITTDFPVPLPRHKEITNAPELILTPSSALESFQYPNASESLDSSPSTSDPVSHTTMGKGQRQKKKPSYLSDFTCNAVTDQSPITVLSSSSKAPAGKAYPLDIFLYTHTPMFEHAYVTFLSNVSSIQEPSSYTQTSKSKEWVEAMDKELNALEQNETWIVTSVPPGKTHIGCKWVYKVKSNPDGTSERYNAR